MFQYAFLYSMAKKGFIPDVYVQAPEFFEDCAGEILCLYRQGLGKQIDAVSIHIRRTDYVGNHFYANLVREGYYERAIAEFPKDTTFLVFSDDIEWCKRYFYAKDGNFQFAEGNTDIEDMNMMASCKHNIIANSSFSWWAAYINPNPAKVVIAPKSWYTDGDQNRTKLPKEWKRI